MKTDVDEYVKKVQARLVAKGYLQVVGVSFDETFSPVTRLVTVRLISALLRLKIRQMDVETAFHRADLD